MAGGKWNATAWGGIRPRACVARAAAVLLLVLAAWAVDKASSELEARASLDANSEVSSLLEDGAYPAYHGQPWDDMGTPFEGENMAFGPSTIGVLDDTLVYGFGWEEYAPLDSLGRCGACTAVVGPETMPADGEERGKIGDVRPSGWQMAKYDFVSGKYLYNRCHLIGWQLTAENDNPSNLVTGTRSMNIRGMLPFEDEVADYVRETGAHVLYRATPVFADDELVCRGVVLEARSVEDAGEGVSFKVFCHNAEPGVTIDYSTGESTGVSA